MRGVVNEGFYCMESVGLKEEDVLDRTKWKNYTQYNHSSDPRRWEKPEEK